MSNWDGIERRKSMQHSFLPECNQIFIRLEDKIDNLIERADKINGRYEKHMDESASYRTLVTRHDEVIKEAKAGFNRNRQMLWTILITIISSITGFAIIWGSSIKQIEINTERLNKLENYHIK